VLFHPPRCPFAACPAHSQPLFRYQRRGFFTRKCDGRPVQRFRCLHCRRFFSSQSFRLDYRLKLPYLHLELFRLFVSKLTLRQAARITGRSRGTVEHRLRLLGGHCLAFQRLRLRRIHGRLGGNLLLDELETFEQNRIEKPLTVPVAVHRASFFVLDTAVAPLPARRRASSRRTQELEQAGALPVVSRRSGSRQAVTAVFRRIAELLGPAAAASVTTDKKRMYARVLAEIFGGRLAHQTVSGRAQRTPSNPLFPINHCLAMMRDGLSRLVRQTWAHAKKAERLERHLWIWICYRNYVRWRTNKTPGTTAAMELGVERKPLSVEELLRWNPMLTS
jgi:transposase-like protein